LPGFELHSPHRAPRPNRKLPIPVQPGVIDSSVTAATTEPKRVFIVISLMCKASVFVDLASETAQNYVAISVVQTQRCFFSATIR
jgi:hypothetical protein